MPSSTRSVRILLTAAEAYPALERAFLGATSEVWASFMVFDLQTRLRSPEALAIGRTWFDLIVHTLNRGVALNICLSDSDGILRPAMSRRATRQMRWFSAAAAVARSGARLKVQLARHPAEVGALFRLVLWPRAMKMLCRSVEWLNSLNPAQRVAALRDIAGVAQHLRQHADGTMRVKFLSLPRLFPVVHHQKLAVIDRQLLYIGGLDLDARRDEPPNHSRTDDQIWHDVQLMIEGPEVAEAQQHLESFREVIEASMPEPKTRRLLRTLSRRRPVNLWHFGPQPLVNELRSAHLVLARRATTFIYLESRYFRDRSLALTLADDARRTPDLGMILILPATADDADFDGSRSLESRLGEALQARALRILRKGFGARLFIGSPAQPSHPRPDGTADVQNPGDGFYGAPVVHMHAKVSVFDDKAAIVSSANLNRRSLRWNTEAGVYLAVQNDVLELRHRVMAHWLPANSRAEAYGATTAVREWTRIAWSNATKRPTDRDGYLLPHEFAVAEAFGRTLPMTPPEWV